jgi:hypothetical protein
MKIYVLSLLVRKNGLCGDSTNNLLSCIEGCSFCIYIYAYVHRYMQYIKPSTTAAGCLNTIFLRNFPYIHSFPQPKDIILTLGLLAFMFLWWVGSRPTAPTPNPGDQDFLSGLTPLAFGVPTPLLQGNKICNPRQGPLQGAVSFHLKYFY